MINKIQEISKLIGNTPTVKLKNHKFNIYAKLENFNFSGSIKDRAVNNILYNAIREGKITEKTKIIESSSGNFAISTALHCRKLGIDFFCVVDPCINPISLKKLQLLATKVIQISEADETGGYLLNRIKKIQQIIEQHPNFFWTNQYENSNNYKGYKSLVNEIVATFSTLDYVFVSVSSTGTITGLCKYLKQKYLNVKIIAVDIKGSMIFSDEKCKRYISGIGASKRSAFLDQCEVDDVLILDDLEIIEGCDLLLKEQSLFMGASSGASYFGALKYLNELNPYSSANSLIICPDEGTSYIDSIYNEEWRKAIKKMKQEYIVI